MFKAEIAALKVQLASVEAVRSRQQQEMDCLRSDLIEKDAACQSVQLALVTSEQKLSAATEERNRWETKAGALAKELRRLLKVFKHNLSI